MAADFPVTMQASLGRSVLRATHAKMRQLTSVIPLALTLFNATAARFPPHSEVHTFTFFTCFFFSQTYSPIRLPLVFCRNNYLDATCGGYCLSLLPFFHTSLTRFDVEIMITEPKKTQLTPQIHENTNWHQQGLSDMFRLYTFSAATRGVWLLCIYWAAV